MSRTGQSRHGRQGATRGGGRVPHPGLRGRIFDGSLFLANTFWVVASPPDPDVVAERTVGLLLVIAVVTQLLGAILKRGPLVRRLYRRDPVATPLMPKGFLGGVLFFHFLLFTVATLMGVMLFTAGPNANDADPSGWTMFFVVTFGGIVTYFVARAASVPAALDPDEGAGPGLEAVADLLLWISMIIMTYFFWGLLYTETDGIRGAGISARGIVFLVASSLLFVVFYLPERYLFLIEDHREPWTWVQTWAAMLPLALIVLVG